MTPERKARILAKLLHDFDELDMPQQDKDAMKESAKKLMDKLEENDSWDPIMKKCFEELDELGEVIDRLKKGTL